MINFRLNFTCFIHTNVILHIYFCYISVYYVGDVDIYSLFAVFICSYLVTVYVCLWQQCWQLIWRAFHCVAFRIRYHLPLFMSVYALCISKFFFHQCYFIIHSVYYYPILWFVLCNSNYFYICLIIPVVLFIFRSENRKMF